MPDLKSVLKLNNYLNLIGNLSSDGRPILGLSAKELLKITLNICPEALFIPAHIWTPWFSMFGSMSGFDSMKECFDDYSRYILAIETGLSSDPQMNWRIKELD
ncbi:MAG: DNA helicase UvrD, partial [Minisyncoccia bacterium]